MNSKTLRTFLFLTVFGLCFISAGRYFDSRCDNGCLAKGSVNVRMTRDAMGTAFHVEREIQVGDTVLKKIEVETVTADVKFLKSTNAKTTVVLDGFTSENLSDVERDAFLRTVLDEQRLTVSTEGKASTRFRCASVTKLSLTILLPGAADDTIVETVSGNVDMSQFNVRKLSASSVSGDIEVAEAAEAQHLNSVSGDLTLTLQKISGDVFAKSISGDVVTAVPADSSVQVQMTSQSGEVSSEISLSDSVASEHRMNGKLGDGKFSLSLQSVSGDLSLESKM